MQRAAERRGRDRADGRWPAGIGAQRVARQVRGQVRGHADRAHARTAAAVRDAEGLVQVQVADVGADAPGLASPTSAFMLAPSM